MAGRSEFEQAEFHYPKPLIEVQGKPLIERVINCFDQLEQEKQFIFIVNVSDCQRYHLDNVLRLITDERCIIIQLEKETRGAACSALMAIEYIENDAPLIISNSDHIIDYDLNRILHQFQSKNLDAGVLCFESVHPKWSFVRLDENGKIIETAEKRPLSKNAIAGFYYFRNGKDFVQAAMKMIEKDAHVDGSYYIAPTLNELVLDSKNLEMFHIPATVYYNFYSPHKFKEYELMLQKKRSQQPSEEEHPSAIGADKDFFDQEFADSYDATPALVQY